MFKKVLIFINILIISVIIMAEPYGSALKVRLIPGKRKQITVGDPIDIDIKIRYRKGKTTPRLEKNFPQYVELIDEVLVKKDVLANSIEERRKLRLALFQTGKLTIGPFRYNYIDRYGKLVSLQAGPISVLVVSVLKKGDNKPSPPESPFVIPYPTWKLVSLIAVGLIIIFLFLLIILYLKKRKERKYTYPPLLPPYEEAIDSMQRLMARKLPEHGMTREFYFETTGIIKHFLGRELEIYILERTTEEIQEELESFEFLSEQLKKNIIKLLKNADMVKFASYHPLQSEISLYSKHCFDLIKNVHREVNSYKQNFANKVEELSLQEVQN